MFVITLKFGENKIAAKDHMQGHNDWIAAGLRDGVFLFVGSLKPAQGGVIFAQGESKEAIEIRVQQDPFVAERVVAAEILEVVPGRVDPRLEFLVEN